MYPHVAYVFIDGGYLRSLSRERKIALVNPRKLASSLAESVPVQTWAHNPATRTNALLGRVTYYDALPGDGVPPNQDLLDYWKAIEVLEDVHLGFGAVKGLKRQARQKGVDVLIAVDMLVGAFSGLFDIAVIVTGDADFVPVVEEVKRRGVMVAIAASASSLSDDLRRVADRVVDIPQNTQWLQPMDIGGRSISM